MQQIPPETSNLYMVVGYAIVVLFLVGMIIWFVNRVRRARAEIRMLEELEKEDRK